MTESIAQGSKTMWTRSGEAVTGIFKKENEDANDTVAESNVDPLRLDRKTEVNAEVLVANGRLWESTGNLQKAMENYTKALEKEPGYPDALTNIARLHYRQGNHQQAADFFGRAIKENPNDAGLYNDLGLTLSKLNNYAAADQTLTRALQLAPGTSRYANNLASVKFEAGNKTAAFEVLSANNKPAIAHFNMAYLHYKHGEMNDAQTHLSEVVKFAPLAVNDASVKQAVDRSREMLAQISAPAATIANLPKGLPLNPAAPNNVRQTGQQAQANDKALVAPATGTSTETSGNTVTPSMNLEVTTPANSAAAAVTPETAAMVPTTPAVTPGTNTVPPATNTVPPKPAEPAPAAASAELPAANVPFALPPGFEMPTN
jgi:tetratricopeptide (TPR) repeat protein